MPSMWDDMFAAGQGGFGANPYQRAAMPQSLPGPYDAPPQALRGAAGFDPARVAPQMRGRQLQQAPPQDFGLPAIRPSQQLPAQPRLPQSSGLAQPSGGAGVPYGNLMEHIAQLMQSGSPHPNLAAQRQAPPPGGFDQFLANERRLSPDQVAPKSLDPMQLEEQRRQTQAGQTPFVEDLNRLTRPTQRGIQQAPQRLLPHQIPQPRVEQMLPAQRMPKPMSPMFTGTLDREGREVFGELRRDPSQVPGRLAPQSQAALPMQRAPQPGTTFTGAEGRQTAPPQGFGGMATFSTPKQSPGGFAQTTPTAPMPTAPKQTKTLSSFLDPYGGYGPDRRDRH